MSGMPKPTLLLGSGYFCDTRYKWFQALGRYLDAPMWVLEMPHPGVPESQVYAVATFYSSFRLAPKGRHEVTLCTGTVCHLKGAGEISEAISREFAVEPGGTTPDRLFSFQPVNCVGACALAPVMIVDGEYHGGLTVATAVELLRGLSDGTDDAEGGGDTGGEE